MAVWIVDARILMHWPLASHQRLNSAVHKDVHQSRASKNLLLQHLECHKKRSHFVPLTRLHPMIPVVHRHWLPTGKTRGAASCIPDVEPLALIPHEGGEQDLEVPHLLARSKLEVD